MIIETAHESYIVIKLLHIKKFAEARKQCFRKVFKSINILAIMAYALIKTIDCHDRKPCRLWKQYTHNYILNLLLRG